MNIVFSGDCLKYRAVGHPESPERLVTASNFLKDKLTFINPVPVEEKDLLLAHGSEHIERIRSGNFFDFDSPCYDDIYYYATLAAGGAVKAMEIQGFSLMRPPGHHAGKNFLGGFCYFNNLAVAVRKSGLKTLIVDFDGHHGNGTEDIFLGDENVSFISIHRIGIFPGSGHHSSGNVFNYPLARQCGDEKYLKTLETALDRVADIEFEQLAVSAGFDGHVGDPIASLGISTPTYQEIGKMLAGLNLPTFAVLEGGYVGEDLGKNILSFINGIKSR